MDNKEEQYKPEYLARMQMSAKHDEENVKNGLIMFKEDKDDGRNEES